MKRVKVLAKGQIVIPSSLRKKYGIQPGCEVSVFEYGDIIHIVPPSQEPIEDAMGCLPPRPSLSKELLMERKKEIQR